MTRFLIIKPGVFYRKERLRLSLALAVRLCDNIFISSSWSASDMLLQEAISARVRKQPTHALFFVSILQIETQGDNIFDDRPRSFFSM